MLISPAWPGAVAVDTSVVEVFIRILGFNLVPFDTPQQAALKEALAAVVPSITAPVRCPQAALQSQAPVHGPAFEAFSCGPAGQACSCAAPPVLCCKLWARGLLLVV